MAIQMRRGNYADYDESRIRPGEWAVATDTEQVFIGVASGAVEMAKKSDVDAMAETAEEAIIDAKAKALTTIYGSLPTTVSTVAQMVDHDLTYIYSGSETGYTAGHWYYWDGTAWTDGGQYVDKSKTNAPIIYNTASGAVASFSDGADNYPIKGLTVAVKPVQSGSGDPSPSNVRPISGFSEVNVWDDPKYGGVVVWNQIIAVNGSNKTQNGVTFTINTTNKKMHVSGTPTARVYNYITKTKAPNIQCRGNDVIFIRNIGTVPTGVAFGGSFYEDSTYMATIPNKKESIVKAPATANRIVTGLCDVTASLVGTAVDFDYQCDAFNLTQMFGSTIADYVYSLEQATEGAGEAWFKNLFPKDYYEYNEGEVTCVSAVNGDPYRHITISLGDTVYGGTLDVVGGKIVVNRKAVDMGGLTWTYVAGDTVFYASIADKADGYAGIICSAYKTGGDTGYGTPDYTIGISTSSALQKRVFVSDPNYTNATAFKNAVTGQTIIYALATPIEITLTPTQINTLLGANNVYSDAGDVSVEYPADTKQFILNAIASALA